MRHFFDVPRGVREQALYTSFLNMVPGLLMAGARSPNPAQAAQGYGMAVQGFGQGGQDYLNNWRNMQALGFATRKAQREEEGAERRRKYVEGLPESERPLAELGPEQYVTGKMRAPPESLAEITAKEAARQAGRPSPAPRPPIRVGNQLVDPDTMLPVFTAPEKPPGPQGPPKSQTIDLPNNLQQRQQWIEGQGWRNVGEPVPRWQPERPPIVTNPLTGESGTVNRAESTLTPLTQPPPSLPPNVPPRPKPVISDVTQYGPKGAVGEIAQKYTFGAYQPGAESTASRQKYRLLRETLIDAFARSGRPSNYAQQRVEELMPSTGVFESQTRAYDMMVETHQTLQQNMVEDAEIAQDRSMPLNEQKEAIGRIRAAQRAMAMIGDPAQWPRPGKATLSKDDEELIRKYLPR